MKRYIITDQWLVKHIDAIKDLHDAYRNLDGPGYAQHMQVIEDLSRQMVEVPEWATFVGGRDPKSDPADGKVVRYKDIA